MSSDRSERITVTSARRLGAALSLAVVGTAAALYASDHTLHIALVAIGLGLCLHLALAATGYRGPLARRFGGLDRDPLCGLPTRRPLRDKLRSLLASQRPAAFALLYVDVEGVRELNDLRGADAGDRLIVAAARRLGDMLRPGDFLARIGGDEFALLRTGCSDRSQATAHAAAIVDAMRVPFVIDGEPVHATASIGVTLAPGRGGCVDTSMRCADAALRRAKGAGKNRFDFFDPAEDGIAQDERALKAALRHAVDRGQLVLHYQPVVAADTLDLKGVEALLRWQHPERGLLTPSAFIPLAEDGGTITTIGEWVMREACRVGLRWPTLRVAINVSPAQFRDDDFLPTVERILAETGFDPSRLEIELTESVVIDDAARAERCIVELRSMGIRVAIDDFGTGYSSLIYLRRFAFDKMKIDKSFVQLLDDRGESEVLLRSIVELGHALGLTVTAEGIETLQQQSQLQKLRCNELQGFLYAPAVPAEEIDALLAARRSDHISDGMAVRSVA